MEFISTLTPIIVFSSPSHSLRSFSGSSLFRAAAAAVLVVVVVATLLSPSSRLLLPVDMVLQCLDEVQQAIGKCCQHCRRPIKRIIAKRMLLSILLFILYLAALLTLFFLSLSLKPSVYTMLKIRTVRHSLVGLSVRVCLFDI